MGVEELAKKIGIPYHTYYKFVKGGTKQMSKTRFKLCKFYNENIKNKVVEKPVVEQKPQYKAKTEKVYLESVEEIISELKNGSEIYINDSEHSLKLVDDYLVCYKKGGAISINPVILCSERYYVIKPIPLKLEVGKRYRAKNGSIVTIFNADGHKFVGVVDGREGFVEYYPNGVHYYENEYDLVEEL
mgnify:CR=1 FL=1